MDNTEGSRAILSTFRARKNLELHLSDQQISILLGSILGDAYIHPQGKICIEHSNAQKDYLMWKYQQLQNLAYPKVAQVTRFDKRTNSVNISWRFYLKQYFRPLRSLFYRQGQKVVPMQLTDWLDQLGLATWYMDDGYLDRGVYPQFMTESFSAEHNLFLINLFKTKFGLEAKLSSKNRILITKNSANQFFHLIEHHIHESLKYKLP